MRGKSITLYLDATIMDVVKRIMREKSCNEREAIRYLVNLGIYEDEQRKYRNYRDLGETYDYG